MVQRDSKNHDILGKTERSMSPQPSFSTLRVHLDLVVDEISKMANEGFPASLTQWMNGRRMNTPDNEKAADWLG